MKEYVVLDDNLEKISEEELVAIACKKAYDINGFVGIRNTKTGKFKQVMQKNAIKLFADTAK